MLSEKYLQDKYRAVRDNLTKAEQAGDENRIENLRRTAIVLEDVFYNIYHY